MVNSTTGRRGPGRFLQTFSVDLNGCMGFGEEEMCERTVKAKGTARTQGKL